MNKKGGLVGYFFALAVFILVWAVFLGSWLSQIGADFVTANSLVGLEAFIAANINLWVMFGVLAAGAIGLAASGGAQ
jgi:uncharacterized membrane protein (UPF0136 family)